MPSVRKSRYGNRNERRYSSRPYAQEIVPSRSYIPTGRSSPRYQYPHDPMPRRHSYDSSSDRPFTHHCRRPPKPPSATHYIHNPPFRNIRDSRYNDTIRDILIQAAIVERNVSNLLERLQWLAPDEGEMSWEPSSVVYTLNRNPTQDELDRMVEARLLSVVKEETGGRSGEGTVMGGVEEVRDSDAIIAEAEAERRRKEGEGFKEFGCGDGSRFGVF